MYLVISLREFTEKKVCGDFPQKQDVHNFIHTLKQKHSSYSANEVTHSFCVSDVIRFVYMIVSVI